MVGEASVLESGLVRELERAQDYHHHHYLLRGQIEMESATATGQNKREFFS